MVTMLRLLFAYSHPALAPDEQVALTLHKVCGLTPDEIAKAFLMPAPALAECLARARAKLGGALFAFAMPDGNELMKRIDPVLATIYVVFNEGYSPSFGGALVRADLCAEAIHLGRLVIDALPHAPNAASLLALMLFHDARRSTRVDANGDFVSLEKQDRARWNHRQIAEAAPLLQRALRARPVGRYAIEAAIAGLHAQASSAEATDWRQIADLYGVLAELHPSPVVALNRAVAVAMADGPERGLELLATIDLPGYHLLPAARADLLRRLGRSLDAAKEYRAALAIVTNDVERRLLERKLAEIESN
jgi:RNA polymerase sigma-70 factor (ECF subfamily)